MFTIKLVDHPGINVNMAESRNVEYGRFIYVWISGESQVVNAEVVNNRDGTLTARYIIDFPGHYLISVEDVDLTTPSGPESSFLPILGSPFDLHVTGEPTLDPDALPLCENEDEKRRSSSVWRPGSWLSSRVASTDHGVLRDGWVFQPRDCVHDAFSFDDLLVLAAREDPTWLVVVGGSIQRGLFLSLVDMILQKGQKDMFKRSVIDKCWGWSDVRLGNLHVSYQV